MKKKHGTRGQYVEGCRCAKCTKANRVYQREYMRNKYYGTEEYNERRQQWRRKD